MKNLENYILVYESKDGSSLDVIEIAVSLDRAIELRDDIKENDIEEYPRSAGLFIMKLLDTSELIKEEEKLIKKHEVPTSEDIDMKPEDTKLLRDLYSKCDCGDPQECSTCYGYANDERYLKKKYKRIDI